MVAPPPCDLSGSGFACPLPCEELTLACGAICGANGSRWRSINAITLSTRDMAASTIFYEKLGLYVTWRSDAFTTLSSANVSGSHALMHVNLNASAAYKPPPKGRWNEWGRFIVYVRDVDAVYALAKRSGYTPEGPPADAPWGERYFHIIDPMGHELAVAQPLSVNQAPLYASPSLQQKTAGT